jgi:hypothetical protein
MCKIINLNILHALLHMFLESWRTGMVVQLGRAAKCYIINYSLIESWRTGMVVQLERAAKCYIINYSLIESWRTGMVVQLGRAAKCYIINYSLIESWRTGMVGLHNSHVFLESWRINQIVQLGRAAKYDYNKLLTDWILTHKSDCSINLFSIWCAPNSCIVLDRQSYQNKGNLRVIQFKIWNV